MTDNNEKVFNSADAKKTRAYFLGPISIGITIVFVWSQYEGGNIEQRTIS